MHADTRDPGCQRNCTAADEPAAAAADQYLVRQHAEFIALFGNFESYCTLARDDELVIVRRDKHSAALRRQIPSDGLAISRIPVVGNHFATKSPGVLELGTRCVLRHDDC